MNTPIDSAGVPPVHGAGPSRPTPERLGWTLGFIALVILAVAILQVTIRFAIGSANSWPDLTPATYLQELAKDFGQYIVWALVMLAVIEPVRRRGPVDGGRRAAAVAAAVILAVLVVSAGRSLAFAWLDPRNPANGAEMFLSGLPRFLTLAGLLTTVGEFYRAELRSLESMRAAEADRAALDQQTLQARLKTLEAQIEPHFLFNTLANVRRLYESDLDAGDAMLGRLMRYLEIALPSMRQDQSTLAREAELIRAFLELQQVRMGRRLAFTIDVPAALAAVEVPPMMLLTLVENAIKHGLAPLREGGRVDITARLHSSVLRLEVSDTGRGFGEGTSGGGTGLANIRARLAAMFGPAAAFTLESRVPSGIKAAITLPASP